MRGSVRAIVAVLVVSAGTTACGGGPAGPSGSRYPNVTGSYAGNATFTFPELQESYGCPASTSVTQDGGNVNVAPIVLRGQCAGVSIPFGAVNIDTTGAIQGGGSGTTYEPSCGTYHYSASGGFFGRELRLSVIATSSTCYNYSFTAVLTR